MKPRRSMLILVLGLAGLGAGCFGIFSRGGGAEPTASVRVLNDVSPPATLTVELRVEGKNTATLGTVEPGQDRVLSYSSSSLQGPYQLVAHQPSGAAVVSREFTLFNGARVQWQVRGNTLSVLQDR